MVAQDPAKVSITESDVCVRVAVAALTNEENKNRNNLRESNSLKAAIILVGKGEQGAS